MSGFPLLIAVALVNCPLKVAGHTVEDRSWLSSAVVGSVMEHKRGVQSEPVLGYQNGQPMPLLVVEMPTQQPTKVRAEVHTALAYLRMQQAATRFGLTLQLNSGFRTNEQQQEVFGLYRRGKGPLAARPGFSNHQSGYALDIDTKLPRVRSWLSRHAYRYGFQRTVPSESWHWEFRGELRKLLERQDPLQPNNS